MIDLIDVLVLSVSEVRSVLTMDKAIDLVESAFREKGLGRVQMPPKTYLFFNKYSGDLRVMPAYLESLNAAGVKVVNVHPLNPVKRGLPTVMAIVVIVDPETGRPLSIMDGTWLTCVRTAAAAAVATKYLARSDSKTLGIIGAGALAPFHIDALSRVLRVESLLIYDVDRGKAERTAIEAQERLGVRAIAVSSPREAVEGVDVLTTLTPSRKPVVLNDWITGGIHINAMGADAPGKEELDPLILKRAKIIVDDFEQAVHSGEVNVPISSGFIDRSCIHAELGEIIAGLKKGRESSDEVTVFDSTGLAIQDVIVASYVYSEAVKRGLGKTITLH